MICIQERTARYVINGLEFAWVALSTARCGDDKLIWDGGAISTKEKNKVGYCAIHNVDEREFGVFSVINKKIEPATSIAFMSVHSNPFT